MTARIEPEILVFGGATCLASQWVRRALAERGASFHYVDFQDFDRVGADISFVADANGERAGFFDYALDQIVSTERVRSAYFREVQPKQSLWQLQTVRLREPQAPDAERFHWQQVQRFCASLLEYLGRRCFCLYPKTESGTAASKLRQLDLARDLGFAIPETYVGNDLEAMRAFAAEHRRVISKPFYPQSLFHEGNYYRTYTALFTLDDLAPFADTRYPLILQEAIVDKLDIRVGVVGRKVFATEIHLGGGEGEPETSLDFRHFLAQDLLEGGNRSNAYRPHELPADVRERCLELVRRSALQYSMIDLLLTPGGEYVFLESNTKGMHGEVEFGGHDVIGAIADLLIDPEANRLV
jgi:hypothetical protein